MNLIREILNDFVIYFKPTHRWGVLRLFLVLVAVGIIVFLLFSDKTTPVTEQKETGVKTFTVSEYNNGGVANLIGQVKAVDQASITAEVGGTVTDVKVELGNRVAAGQILATLENASQYASLISAEGAYEAAVARAKQSNFSVASSEETLTVAYSNANDDLRTSLISVENVMRDTVADYFSGSTRLTLNLQDKFWTKKVIEYDLADWREATLNQLAGSELVSQLDSAIDITTRAYNLASTIYSEVVAAENGSDSDNKATLATYRAELTTAKNSLASQIETLRSSKLNIQNTEATLARNQSSSLGGNASAEEAQVKQALGALKSAQAAYNKTILRSPISGTVQSLNISTGDHISATTLVATVANQNALQITAYINQTEREQLHTGDKVTIDNHAEGVITAIAPAIDSATGKIAVKIQTEDTSITNGDTVRLSVAGSAESTVNTELPIIVPITALKVETDRTVVFSIDSEGRLVAHEVETGSLLGDKIVINHGLNYSDTLVLDARGLNENDLVTVLN